MLSVESLRRFCSYICQSVAVFSEPSLVVPEPVMPPMGVVRRMSVQLTLYTSLNSANSARGSLLTPSTSGILQS